MTFLEFCTAIDEQFSAIFTILAILIALFAWLFPQEKTKIHKVKILIICLSIIALLSLNHFLLPHITGSTPESGTTPPTPTATVTPIPTPTPTPIWPPEIYGEVPSSKALDVIGDDMLYPKASSYLAEYETMYVKSTKGQGIYAYWAPKTDEEYKKIDAILEATEVTVLARENGMSCVIFINQRDHRHAAWVNSTRLVYEYK